MKKQSWTYLLFPNTKIWFLLYQSKIILRDKTVINPTTMEIQMLHLLTEILKPVSKLNRNNRIKMAIKKQMKILRKKKDGRIL